MNTTEPELDRDWLLLFSAWLIATLAALGSLFFSEVMEFAPCSLCWYQRIFMYPLVLVLAIGLFPVDRGAVRFGLPLAIGGWLIAAYHLLLYLGIVPESASPCRQGVSCKEEYIEVLGFLSIPALSLLAFSTVVGLLLILRRRLKT
ncbi:MAG: disulfide bond formation protein B [Rickettsiales bacterium]|nr:disulfide bond formation protein B [Rickettsiales bacterium]